MIYQQVDYSDLEKLKVGETIAFHYEDGNRWKGVVSSISNVAVGFIDFSMRNIQKNGAVWTSGLLTGEVDRDFRGERVFNLEVIKEI